MILDGSREMLGNKWTYWKGPAFACSMPIKWKIVADPVDKGTVLMSDDPVSESGKFGSADIVFRAARFQGGIKLQGEGHDVRFRNAWIKEIDLKTALKDFTK